MEVSLEVMHVQAKAFEVELPPVNRTNAHGNADASFSSDCLLQKSSEVSKPSRFKVQLEFLDVFI